MSSVMDAPLNPKDVSLLWAAPEFADAIADLHGRLFDPPWDAASVAQLIEHPAAAAFVAQMRQPKVMAGFLIAQIAGDEAEILTIGVAPEWQRLGIARYMVEGLVRAARRAEVRRLFLEVAVTNTAANGLYRALGFELVGRRKGYYQRPGAEPVDAAVLALAL